MNRLHFLTVVCVGLAEVGCLGATCDRHPDDAPTVFEDGITSPSGTHYMTSEFDGEFLSFPGGFTYQLEHGLDRAPTRITTYLSFTAHPLAAGGGGLTESAGNQTVIEDSNDEFIQIRNDTCADFFLRVEASTGDYDDDSAPSSEADAGN